MKILLTGASSFTGSWIAPALARAGHEVTAVFTRSGLHAYEGLRRARVQRVLPFVRPVWGVESGDLAFVQLCRAPGGWDLLCLHGAEVGEYKVADFDWRRALARNSRGYAEIFSTLAANAATAVVLTGSYFEADEGNPDGAADALSPYGLSKTLTWQACRHECLRAGLGVGKFVIPNPVGPFEEPKLVANLTREWLRGSVPRLRTPQDVGDNLPVTALAASYAKFAAEVCLAGRGAVSFCRPSGWCETVANFSQRVAAEFGRMAGATFQVAADKPVGSGAAVIRRNRPAAAPAPALADEAAFWREWFDYYFSRAEIVPAAAAPAAVPLSSP